MWLENTIDGHWFQAKVSDVPVRSGINGSKVFKLLVSSSEHFVEFDTTHCCYNYDRSLDFDNAPAGLIANIIVWCEAQ